jgi:hypothetical protein
MSQLVTGQVIMSVVSETYLIRRQREQRHSLSEASSLVLLRDLILRRPRRVS